MTNEQRTNDNEQNELSKIRKYSFCWCVDMYLRTFRQWGWRIVSLCERERESSNTNICVLWSAADDNHLLRLTSTWIKHSLQPRLKMKAREKKWKQLYLISQATLFLFLLFLSMVKPFQPSKVESETANTPERGRESERKDFYHFWRNRNRNVAIDNYFSWNDVICKRMFFCDFGRVLCSHR